MLLGNKETNRFNFLNLDSRSETDNRSEFIQGSEQREIMKACFHFRVARESRKFSAKHKIYNEEFDPGSG